MRHGVGTLYSPSASIFVGTFVGDKRQGLGVTYWGGRCRKYVAEYVDDSPTCGAVLSLEDDTVEAPATQQLRDAIAAARVTAAGLAVAAEADGSGCGVGGVPEMPELTLMQPSKVRVMLELECHYDNCIANKQFCVSSWGCFELHAAGWIEK